MEHTIIIIALYLIYYHISGLATTNIIRLTKGNTQPVLFPKCYCDNCENEISPILQLPIISYIICKGKCKHCGIKIPIYPLLLEIIILSGMCITTTLFKFSFWGVTGSYLFYEIVRVAVVLIKGKREKQFIKQYFIAVISMVPFYLLTLFVSALYSIV